MKIKDMRGCAGAPGIKIRMSIKKAERERDSAQNASKTSTFERWFSFRKGGAGMLKTALFGIWGEDYKSDQNQFAQGKEKFEWGGVVQE